MAIAPKPGSEGPSHSLTKTRPTIWLGTLHSIWVFNQVYIAKTGTSVKYSYKLIILTFAFIEICILSISSTNLSHSRRYISQQSAKLFAERAWYAQNTSWLLDIQFGVISAKKVYKGCTLFMREFDILWLTVKMTLCAHIWRDEYSWLIMGDLI